MPARLSPQQLQEKFWERVRKTKTCWEFQGHPHDKYGYRRFYIGFGIYAYVHRLSWVWCKGKIPSGLMVCHKCDNTKCVRPSHLFLGTPKDNVQDCMRKGRWNGGMGRQWAERTHCSAGHKYTPENIRWYFGRGSKTRICITCSKRWSKVSAWRKRQRLKQQKS
jgi:hypothetical protein